MMMMMMIIIIIIIIVIIAAKEKERREKPQVQEKKCTEMDYNCVQNVDEGSKGIPLIGLQGNRLHCPKGY